MHGDFARHAATLAVVLLAASAGPAAAAGASYGGGPVMLGANHVYYIWYGDWSSTATPAILDDMAEHIGGSPYWGIETTYYEIVGGVKKFVSNSLTLGGEHFDSYSHGKVLSDALVLAVVEKAIADQLPLDANGIYFVLGSADVKESSGFCSAYCGWRDHVTYQGTDIKYAFVGNPDACPSACEPGPGHSPNGDPAADAMASTIVHLLDETVIDPDLNAWICQPGIDCADKCGAGPTFTCNGALADVTWGTRCYFVGENWKNAGAGSCAMH
ncbi:MAG: EXORDIUM family protein [Acidobacteriota bacterium]|nr:EXORDIUM family protein [Acidobacteriota bacterium]